MDILQFIYSVIDKGQVQVLAYLCAANLILGIVAALAKGNFELAKLADFWKRVVVVFGSYISVAIAVKAMADFEPLRTAIWAALIALMVAHIIGNLKDMGLPIPEPVMKWIERAP